MKSDGLINSKINIKISKLKKINIIILSCVIGTFNVLFYKNYQISMIIIALELAILLYYFIKKDITRYLGNYLIFLSLSLEFDALVGTEQFYGFKNFRIFGINLGILSLLPLLVIVFSRKIKIKEIKDRLPNLYKFVSTIIFMDFTGVMFGLLQIIINDNNIQNMDGFLSSFVGTTYNMVALPILLIISIIYIFTWEKENLLILEEYLIAILIGVVVSMIVSLITKNFGTYGGVNTLLVSNVIRYIPFMLLIPFYEEYKSKKMLLLFGIIGLILSLIYNATGKMIILYALIPIGILVILYSRKKILSFILMFTLIFFILLFNLNSILEFLTNSIIFKSKLNQVLSLLKFWGPNWLINMADSPRTRVVEFISIFHEYLKKPWFAILGKGFMGTITDYTGILRAKYVPGAYPMNQWANGTFYGVHESLNILFLYNGFFGLAFYIYMIKFIFCNYKKSPWILIGGFWFLMAYGFSITMSAFGITALLLGFIDIDNREVLHS